MSGQAANSNSGGEQDMEEHRKIAVPEKEQRNYVGYEYKEVVADNSMVSLLLDGYENFGWEINDTLPDHGIGGKPGGAQKTLLWLRRDRKILNKAELTRLQRNFEACISQIQTLEQRKTSAAAASAIILGMAGTAFMAGSTFAATAQPPHYILCTLFAIPGFLGGYFRIFFIRR